jgi:FkbM family methyltransferase
MSTDNIHMPESCGVPITGVPITLVDIGSSGGIASKWRRVKNLTVIEVEPDDRAPQSAPPADQNWPAKRIHLCDALWEQPGEKDFYLTAKQQCSSLFPPNEKVFSRYPNPGRVAIAETRKLRVDTLTNQLARANVDHVDFVKLDAQGAELAILRGAEDLIRNSVLGLEIEVEFLPLYQGQPLFSDIDPYVRSLGFELFELHPTPWKYAQGNGCDSPGQIAFGDALYFRDFDSFTWNDADATHRLAAMILLAELHHRPDFAAYLAERGRAMKLPTAIAA